MSFILRAAFWLTVLAFLLPAAGFEITSKSVSSSGGVQSAALTDDGAAAAPDISATEALSLAARSAQDAMGFCGRNPDVCERSGDVLSHVMRQTAYYGSQLFLWLTDKARATTEQHEMIQQAPKGPAETPLPAPRPRMAASQV